MDPLAPWTADGWIFDMDGVVTDTASVHQEAWKALFDSFLEHRSPAATALFTQDDYRTHVDGRARFDGVTSFLGSRGIELPVGEPSDPAGVDTAWGLANRKNQLFLAAVEQRGVRAFPSTVEVLHRLRAAGTPTAVVTASRNAELILTAAGATGLFDDQVDGTIAEAEGLAGKPDPAMFLEAARRLGVRPERSVVVEDALAGVEAGRRGGFGLVIGVDRVGQRDALGRAGADVVVTDLGALLEV